MTDREGPGLSEDEAWEALGELYQSGKVDMIPTVGNVKPKNQQFTLNEQGMEHARDLMREDDDAVLYLVGITLHNAQPFESKRELAETLIQFAEWFAEDSGVNPLRVINRNVERVPFITGELPDALVEYYDQPSDKEDLSEDE